MLRHMCDKSVSDNEKRRSINKLKTDTHGVSIGFTKDIHIFKKSRTSQWLALLLYYRVNTMRWVCVKPFTSIRYIYTPLATSFPALSSASHCAE